MKIAFLLFIGVTLLFLIIRIIINKVKNRDKILTNIKEFEAGRKALSASLINPTRSVHQLKQLKLD